MMEKKEKERRERTKKAKTTQFIAFNMKSGEISYEF